MFKTIQNFNWIILSSFLCIFLGIITFLTFINQGFISLNEANLFILLLFDILLLIFFFYLIFKNIIRIYSAGKKSKSGSKTNLKYITLFSLFTFIPSFLIAIFSLVLFNFGIEKFFNDKITDAVNNSNDVAKSYLEESKKSIKADAILMSVGINRISNLYYSNLPRFKNVIKSEKILRRIDDVYLIDSSGNIMFFDTRQQGEQFNSPIEEDFLKAFQGFPVSISNNTEYKASVMVKLNTLIDTYLYLSRNVDPQILNYLNETEEAVNFYYSVENAQFGIKVTFAIIYVILVTLLLFLSIVVSVTYSKRLSKPIINLIEASKDISMGKLDTKVPTIDSDEEFKMLNTNFNNMIDRLKKQQDKLLSTERFSAWEGVARKLAHEIKNPLTPIQLSIDRLSEKYSPKIFEDRNEFKRYLETINRQIKDIEKLVNEFSNFARMPSPIFKKINVYNPIKRAVEFSLMSSVNKIKINCFDQNTYLSGDEEQLYRVFINLIKNAEDSINEKRQNNPDFKGNIDVEIKTNNDYIDIKLADNGVGNLDIKNVMKPYFTTKKNGTGLGLPIVSKIINEHSGDISMYNKPEGVEILISLPTTYEK
ncbi:ATP-binding protein [Pelagibacteraceae bacterium]|nr:ATP-binding protein [Pelagibacteraceae bacterium]